MSSATAKLVEKMADGLYYNRARWMDPKVGRFESVDPYQGKRCFPATLHKYAYAGLDPVNSADPSGQTTLLGQMSGLGAQAFRSVSVGGLAKFTALAVAGGVGFTLLYREINLSLAESNEDPPRAAHDYSNKQRQAEYIRMKDFCDKKPEGNDECSTLGRKGDHIKNCIDWYKAWDEKWNPGRHADNKIRYWLNELENIKRRYTAKCTQK